jgi:hypothetical protein
MVNADVLVGVAGLAGEVFFPFCAEALKERAANKMQTKRVILFFLIIILVWFIARMTSKM